MNRDERREGLRRTAERLGGECGGAVPPGQILALLFRLHYALAIGFPEEDETGLLHICEVSARGILRRHREGTRLKSPSLNRVGPQPGAVGARWPDAAARTRRRTRDDIRPATV